MATQKTSAQLEVLFAQGKTPSGTDFADFISSSPNLLDNVVTNAEFSYLNGTTSAIQTQINSKASLTGATFSGAVSATNLSGTNTGDQDISGIATNTTAIATKLSTIGGAITGFRPYLTETADRGLTVEDSGTFIIADDAASITFEIPLNENEAFTLGTEIDFIQKDSGVLRITSATGVTLNGVDPNTVAVTAQWGGVTIKKIAEDEWIAVGKI